MLTALLAVTFAPLVSGAYPLPEICRLLTASSGKAHYADAELRDYPVFFATKNGTPERVRTLVASALRAKWEFSEGKYRLKPVKPNFDLEFAEFERQLRIAAAGSKIWTGIPARDLFMMPPGSIARYGSEPNRYILPLPASLKPLLKGEPGLVIVRRFTKGMFESRQVLGESSKGAFSPGSSLEINTAPDEVLKALGKALDQAILTQEEQDALSAKAREPGGFKISYSNLSKQDPLSDIAGPVLQKMALKLPCDFAVGLHDMSLFKVQTSRREAPPTVRTFISGFSAVADWTLVDGAIVAQIPTSERIAASQARRDVLGRFTSSMLKEGAATVDALSLYVTQQRPASSNAWGDAMLLALGGVVLDEEFIGDYPYNMRLYSVLTPSDFEAVQRSSGVIASTLSPRAVQAMQNLLLFTRSRLEGNQVDPALWDSLARNSYVVLGKVVEEQVLIGWTSATTQVMTVRSSANNHVYRKKQLGREPRYQPAVRRKLTLEIQPNISLEGATPVKTGFSQVQPDKAVSPTTWDKLPDKIAKEFAEVLEQRKELDRGRD